VFEAARRAFLINSEVSDSCGPNTILDSLSFSRNNSLLAKAVARDATAN
jgi:hypothetical protein